MCTYQMLTKEGQVLTRKLYYEDPAQLEFRATVAGSFEHAGRTALVLDRTAFYPEGGGQPGDRGTIDGVSVVDTTSADDGSILHWLEGGHREFRPGETVEGAVDQRTRMDHSQQHSAQHLLSQALKRLFDWETVGFRLGKETVTIDLDTDSAGWDQLLSGERLANEVVYRNLPRVITTNAGTEQPLTLRGSNDKGPGIPAEQQRIISFGDFDSVPCGGTHVTSTGEIGSIKILATERVRGQLRLYFVAGERARMRCEKLRAVTQEMGELLTTGLDDYVDAVNRLMTENQQLTRKVRDLTDSLVNYRARDLVAESEELSSSVHMVSVLEDGDMQSLQALATAVLHVGKPCVVLLGGLSGGAAQFVFARSQSVPVDLNGILRSCFGRFGGRGGGRPERAQGGGVPAAFAHSVLEYAAELVALELKGDAQ